MKRIPLIILAIIIGILAVSLPIKAPIIVIAITAVLFFYDEKIALIVGLFTTLTKGLITGSPFVELTIILFISLISYILTVTILSNKSHASLQVLNISSIIIYITITTLIQVLSNKINPNYLLSTEAAYFLILSIIQALIIMEIIYIFLKNTIPSKKAFLITSKK